MLRDGSYGGAAYAIAATIHRGEPWERILGSKAETGGSGLAAVTDGDAVADDEDAPRFATGVAIVPSGTKRAPTKHHNISMPLLLQSSTSSMGS